MEVAQLVLLPCKSRRLEIIHEKRLQQWHLLALAMQALLKGASHVGTKQRRNCGQGPFTEDRG
jgi:hypothetical protein